MRLNREDDHTMSNLSIGMSTDVRKKEGATTHRIRTRNVKSIDEGAK